jgi:hypothetical protein
MTITPKHLLLILGGTLLAIGLVLGLVPVTYDGGPCGSAFVGSDDQDVEALVRSMSGSDPFAFDAGCTDALSSRRTIALALTIPGALLVGAGGWIAANEKKATPAPRDTPST